MKALIIFAFIIGLLAVLMALPISVNLSYDKDNRTITISDNGCGMTEKELESNLGTIAKSGTLNFKKENHYGSIAP